ncbi:sigma-54-dependent Fis family transcriptional regulator [candidate division KSB1 bacterium]|nr:sigma-54-dependent Fis family transcriptional regulator [candidate division KSB1 bacterium]
MPGKILIIDDEKKMCVVLKTALENTDLSVTTADNGQAALAACERERFDMVLTDIKMPGLSGLDVLQKVKSAYPETEVLLMTAYADTQTAVKAMKMGAYDYLIKPFEIDELRHKIAQILEKGRLRAENRNLRARIQTRYSIENMVGKSGAMQRVYELVHKVAESDATVLIYGESGTGKELVAGAIHQLSRRDQPFVAVNCSALPESLLESELFGHEKGAFTGADWQKPGRFELAAQGTLFLDEIGDISPAIQIKLLRVLQEKEFMRLGGTQTLSLQARLVAATNRDLEKAVQEKIFRQDLYYRIHVFPIVLPPLRERREDIADLVSHFLRQQGLPPDGIEKNALDLLLEYPWPGNVRELENAVERASIMAGTRSIRSSDLPPHLRGETHNLLSLEKTKRVPTLEEMEKTLIRRALEENDGNKSHAAKTLGISRRQLYSKMQRLGLPIK